jgi:membrane-bound lytic murein transglycosylase D
VSRRLPLWLVVATVACAGHKAEQRAPVEVAQPTPPPPEHAPPQEPLPRLEVPVNDVVLAQLHKLTATPGARGYMRSALENRKKHVATVHAALAAQRVPAQLDAIPLIESGYQNIDGGKNGAGLWQFIRPTAAHFGLKVTPHVDERMNPTLETAAAARYLRELHDELGDWPLVLAAYSQGITHVRAVVRREGTRDVWTLIRRGKLGPYAARVMAAALLISDPAAAGV